MAKRKNNLPLLLAIGVLISGVAVACSVKDDKPATDTSTAAHIMYRGIFVENVTGTYTPKAGATLTIGGDTMAMAAANVTITSSEADDVYTLSISTTDATQTLKDIQFTENATVNIIGNNYTQKLDVVSAIKATLVNVYVEQTAGGKEITSTDLYIENGELTIFGTVIATKN